VCLPAFDGNISIECGFREILFHYLALSIEGQLQIISICLVLGGGSSCLDAFRMTETIAGTASIIWSIAEILT
jgi:hypothetical protein